jgi:predicted nuclease with TOPRIM domain
MEYKEVLKGSIKNLKEQYKNLSNFQTDNIEVRTLVFMHCVDLEEQIEEQQQELLKEEGLMSKEQKVKYLYNKLKNLENKISKIDGTKSLLMSDCSKILDELSELGENVDI